MKNTVLLLLFVALAGLASANYCSVSTCKGKPHTLCNWNEVNSCRAKLGSGLTADEKNRIVSLHNKLRQKVASGQETRGPTGPQPAAKYMKNLVWDEELATIAQHWADLCNFQHDQCRNRANTEYIGQNLAISGTTGNVNSITVEQLVQMWYDEVKDFDRNRVYKPFQGNGLSGANGQQVGHYTQFVWADTTKIGCGASKYNDGKFNQFYLVCNYGTGGNMIGKFIYQPKDLPVQPQSQSQYQQPQPQYQQPQPQYQQPQPQYQQQQPQYQQQQPQYQQQQPQYRQEPQAYQIFNRNPQQLFYNFRAPNNPAQYGGMNVQRTFFINDQPVDATYNREFGY